MGQTKSQHVVDMQAYHGAKSALKFSLGIDMVVEYWIRNECDIDIRTIPVDIFRLVLNYSAFFDRFDFQENFYWKVTAKDDVRTVTKKNGMGCHHNIMFGSSLTGDICYKCDVKLVSGYDSPYQREREVRKGRDAISVGLVEESYYEYLEQHMHKGNGRCVFRQAEYFDCKGQKKAYDNPDFSAFHGKINFEISINMKQFTFTITSDGMSQTITNIPDRRVICFEVWPTSTVVVSNQRLQWVE
eukprot:538175_1